MFAVLSFYLLDRNKSSFPYHDRTEWSEGGERDRGGPNQLFIWVLQCHEHKQQATCRS